MQLRHLAAFLFKATIPHFFNLFVCFQLLFSLFHRKICRVYLNLADYSIFIVLQPLSLPSFFALVRQPFLCEFYSFDYKLKV